MLQLGPTFYSSPSLVSTIISVSSSVVLTKINSTSALVVYKRSGDFLMCAVVVTNIGGVPYFGTPVVIGGNVVPFTVRELDAGTNQFAVFYRTLTQVAGRVITVSGSTITTPYPESLAPTVYSNVFRGYGEVISTSQVGIMYEAMNPTTFVHGVAGTVSGGTITWGGTPAVTSATGFGGAGARPVKDVDGQYVVYLPWTTIANASSFIGAIKFTMSGLTCTSSGSVVIPATVNQRVTLVPVGGSGSGGILGSVVPLGAGQAGMMYYVINGTQTMSTRGYWNNAGSSVSFSNHDTNQYFMSAGPFSPPPVNSIQGHGEARSDNQNAQYIYRDFSAVKTISLNTAGVPISTNGAITTRASNAGSGNPMLTHLTDSTVLYTYISNTSVLSAGIYAA